VKTDIEHVSLIAERWTAEQVLSWAFTTYGENVAIATGMGAEGMVLLDIGSRLNPGMKVFTGDTEFLFPETYDLIDRVEERYGIKIERILSQLSPEEQERAYGSKLWANDPDRCCSLRKIEPLRRKLSTLDAWITAIRRGQTPQRAAAKKVEWDPKFNLVKINPLADWRQQTVWSYIVKHNVPYNPLHDRNYPSIGCTNCTRAVQAGEDSRAGRWSGFGKTECGLHTPAAPTSNLVQLAAAGVEE
jgi:phosphoadenosine phosphosulfate reductase